MAGMKENRKKELDDLEQRMKNNMKSIVDKSIGEALKNIGTTVSTMIASDLVILSHTSSLTKLETENRKLNRTVQMLAAEQSKLKEKLDQIEKCSLDNCIIIRGIQEQYKETDAMLQERVYAEISYTVLGSDYDEKVELAKKMTIKNCRRLGRYNRTRARPISCELVHKEDVSYIIENRNYLQDGIFVDYEYSPEIERKRRILLPILRAARRLPHYRNNCRLEKDELVINGRHFQINTLNQLPDDLDPFKVTTEEDFDSIGFFGAINPLSNFYECTFKVDEYEYISSEQFIQARKAEYFRDHQTLDRIMGCSTSLDCKQEASYVKNYNRDKWEKVAKEKCRPGLRAKFKQNPDIMEVLVTKTGNKTIVESARDRFWGTSVPLSDPDCLNSTKWVTQGILGELLEEIREDYRKQNPTRCSTIAPLPQTQPPILPSDPAKPMLSTNPQEPTLLTLHPNMQNEGTTSLPAPCVLTTTPVNVVLNTDPVSKDAGPKPVTLRDRMSSVSSMEISDPISDTTAESVRSDLLETDQKLSLPYEDQTLAKSPDAGAITT